MNDFVVESLDPRLISSEDEEAILRLREEVWPTSRVDGLLAGEHKGAWKEYDGPADQGPRTFIIRHGREMIAMAKTLPRMIVPKDRPALLVMGLASVCNAPAWRGKGLGKAIVRAALSRVDRGEYEWAVFQCPEARRSFYEHLGALQAQNTFVRTDVVAPRVNPFWDPCAMRYPAREGWPEGEIGVPSPGW